MLEQPFVLPADKPLLITRGSFYMKEFRWRTTAGTPIDISGLSFEAQFRESYASDSPILTLTTEAGGFQITNGPDGRFRMFMTLAQTRLFVVPLDARKITDIPKKDFVFEIDAIPADPTRRFSFLVGVARVKAEVSPE